MEEKSMSMVQRRDMKFAGIMTIPGGIYKRVSCDGEVTVDGDLDCLELRVNGKYNGTGSMKARNAVIRGAADVAGDVWSDDFKSFGQTMVDGSMSGGAIKSEGKLSVMKDIKVDRTTITGQLITRGNCEEESFFCSGFVEIEGALNAGDIVIKMYGPCHVGEIGGEKINVRKGHESTLGKIATTLFDTIGFHKSRLVAETIEGDDIYLEYTSAKVVRGGRVTIGKGCEIDRVEYRTDYKASSGTSVLQHVKI
jgi:cytoskeletal protein CcmA (bactofilin family)